MFKYEIGDKVKICEDLREGNKYHVYCNSNMETYAGRIMTIMERFEYSGYPAYELREDESRWTFTEDMFEKKEDNDMSTEIKLPETLMNKDVEPYVPTEEERKYLVEAGMELLEEYDYDPTESALNKIYDEWARQNAWMIKLFKKSPNYVDGRFYIKLPATELTRPVDKKGVDEFRRWAIIQIENIYKGKQVMIGLHKLADYIKAKNDVEYICDTLDRCPRGTMYRGMTIEDYRREFKRMSERLRTVKYEMYSRNLDVLLLSQEDANEINYLVRIINKISSLDDFQTFTENDAEYINDCLEKTTIKARAHTGNKTTKFYGKVLRELKIDKVVDIREERWLDQNGVEHSRTKDYGYNYYRALLGDSVNPYTYNRDIIISVNPIDFWTMSFGYKWASCQTIDKENKRCVDGSHNYEGMYSGGTSSLMNDDSTFVMYVLPSEDEEKTSETRPEFRSKLKRCLFSMAEDKLLQSRVYPDGRDGGDEGLAGQLRNIMQKVIADLLETPNMWTIKKGTYNCGNVTNSHGLHYKDYLNYNDCNVSYLRRIDGLLNEKPIEIGTYDIICPHCGYTHSTENCISDCYEGGSAYAVCECCNANIREYDDYIYTTDGRYYCCEDCAEEAGYRWCEDSERWVDIDECNYDEYDEYYYEYDDDAVYTEEGHWYHNEYNAEADDNRWCEDLSGWSNSYYESVDGNYFYYRDNLIEIDGDYYESEESAEDAGYTQNDDGEWIPAVA